MSEKKQPLNGKRVSKSTRLLSKAKSPPARRRLEQLLRAAYKKFQKMDDPRVDAACRHNFVFHMTDWFEDLERLAQLYEHPEKFDKKTATDIVVGFLYHVIPHLRAAGRLMLDYMPDDFFNDLDYKASSP